MVVVLLVVALTADIVARHATKGRCLMIFIVFGSLHLSRRGYNNNEYYYDRRKSAAAMAYLAAAAPKPLSLEKQAFDLNLSTSYFITTGAILIMNLWTSILRFTVFIIWMSKEV